MGEFRLFLNMHTEIDTVTKTFPWIYSAPTASISKQNLISSSSIQSLKALDKNDPAHVMGPPADAILRMEEKRFLLMIERGDYNGVKKLDRIFLKIIKPIC